MSVLGLSVEHVELVRFDILLIAFGEQYRLACSVEGRLTVLAGRFLLAEADLALFYVDVVYVVIDCCCLGSLCLRSLVVEVVFIAL